MHNLLVSRHRAVIRGAVVAAVTPLVLLAGCGSDDDTSSTATTTAAEDTNSAVADAFPSDGFCTAQADFEAAQDGAQRNTAIGEMQNALGGDAPLEISDALDTLLTGDLSPEQYTTAGETLAQACS